MWFVLFLMVSRPLHTSQRSARSLSCFRQLIFQVDQDYLQTISTSDDNTLVWESSLTSLHGGLPTHARAWGLNSPQVLSPTVVCAVGW